MQQCTTEQLTYDHMPSQSEESLPVIYQEFDVQKMHHWADRADILDFLFAVNGENKRLLDFGPGDGWPSLGVAPFAEYVIGLDSSELRVKVCEENARKLGISNTQFVWYQSGTHLPFPDNHFDGIMAASSVEQSPDPHFVTKEFYRILKPGGRLRLHYEGLRRYQGGYGQEYYLLSLTDGRSKAVLFDRNIANEQVYHLGLTFSMSIDELMKGLSLTKVSGPITAELEGRIVKERRHIVSAEECVTNQPSAGTLAIWLKDAGFTQVKLTHAGRRVARPLMESLPKDSLPTTIQQLGQLLIPLVKTVIELEAPAEVEPRITAQK